MLQPVDMERLDVLHRKFQARQKHMLGFPINCKPKVKDDLSPFLDFVLNNLGDPFAGGNYGLNTFEFEIEVVQFFARLLGLEHSWGYVSNGGSESNLKGIMMGRERYPDGVLYYSEASHYSIPKAAHMLGLDAVRIAALDDKLCVADLILHLDRHRPAILSLNAGTTMAGACDDIPGILNLLRGQSCFVHVDAALSGVMYPFIAEAPVADFTLDIDTIAISGHKFLGCPIPCGVLVSRHTQKTNRVEYIGSTDSTICGSRDGFSALALWHTIKSLGYEGISELVRQCMNLADYAEERLAGIDWKHWRHPYSNTIVLSRPSAETVVKWQLAVQDSWSHIIVMPHVTYSMIDEFVEDLIQETN